MAEPEAGPSVHLEGRQIPLAALVQQEVAKHGEKYWATQVDVRNMSYKAEVPESSTIETIGNIFFRSKKKRSLLVLNQVNFSLLPFESTLLLGRPRSGKTSLLDLLGCRRKGDTTGTVMVNSASIAKTKNYHRLVSYVQQGDVHLPLLTVKETLEFSAECQVDGTESARFLLPSASPCGFSRSSSSSDRSRVPRKVDETLQLLGLPHAADTVVGDELTRGVSGGERRRVSIGIEWVKDASFFILDEPTTGLDSGAAHNVGLTLRELSLKGTPVLAALLQPSWELVQLFDNLIILSRGEIGYWGPVAEAIPYFETLGFSCPADYSPSEFLSEVVDKPENFPPNPAVPRRANTREALIESYRQSDLYKRMLEEAARSIEVLKRDGAVVGQQYRVSAVYDALQAAKYSRSRLAQLWLLVKRGVRVFYRDFPREMQNLIATALVAVVMGLIFLRLGTTLTASGAKFGLIFFIGLRAAFTSLGSIGGLFMQQPVFYRQRAGHYFAVFPFVISSFLLGIPTIVLEVLIFPTIVYWMANLKAQAGAYLFLLLQALMISLVFVAYSRMWVALMPGALLASTLAATLAGVFIAFTGFLIHRARIPAPWRWAVWATPFFYGFNALAINQFEGQPVTCSSSELQPPTTVPNFTLPYPAGFSSSQICPITSGTAFLISAGLYYERYLQWVFFIATVGWVFLYGCLYYLAQRFVDYSALRVVSGVNDVSKKRVVRPHRVTVPHSSVLSWQDLCYSVRAKGGERLILNNISGLVKPGMLLVLMGASGAGKTTLLDVLARRKNVGKTTGRILVNGRAPDSSYRRLIGYVEQTDLHFAHQTVLEAMEFAAECRLPATVSKEARATIIQSVLDLLALRPIAGAYIGYGGNWGGINPDERKRLSMAVELVAEPAILFLDEPTSGLGMSPPVDGSSLLTCPLPDSNAADVVMAAVQQVAMSGTAVICTIHQPSARIFSRATHLLLLKPGGHVVYFGDLGTKAERMISLFERLGARPLPGQNPADFALAVSMGKAGLSEEQVLQGWQGSGEMGSLTQELEFLESHPPAVSPEYEALLNELRKPYATSFGRQLILHLHRWALSYWRNPTTFVINSVRAILLGLIIGTVFWNRPHDQLGAQERFSVLFFSALNANLTAFSYLPMVFIQRPIFYRERAERMYRTATYGLGYILCDAPIIAFNTFLFCNAFYWLTGLQRTAARFFFYYLASLVVSLVSIMFVQMVGALFARPDTAGIIFGSVFVILGSVAGFLIPLSTIPSFVSWLTWLSFPRFFLNSVGVNEFEGTTYYCDPPLPIPITGTNETAFYCPIQTGADAISHFGLNTGLMWPGIAILFGYYLLFAAVYILALQFISHIRR